MSQQHKSEASTSLVYAWYVVTVLLVAQAFSFLDRMIMGLLVGPIRSSFQISDTQYSLLAGLAFSIGFLALLLGRSELFTEGFLVPVTTVAAKRASFGQLMKLWSGTLVANLAGGWVLMAVMMTALPQLHAQTIESASHYATAPLSAAARGPALIPASSTSAQPSPASSRVSRRFLWTFQNEWALDQNSS